MYQNYFKLVDKGGAKIVPYSCKLYYYLLASINIRRIVKNKFLTIAFILVCCAVAPLVSACFGKGSSDITGIRFVQDVYELDVGTPTKLEYKLYPSTASVSSLNWDVISNDENINIAGKYNIVNGVFTILNNSVDAQSSFPECTIKVSYLDQFSDTCIVRVKQYPTELSLSCNEYLNSGGVGNLSLSGYINGKWQDINSASYSLLVESDNPSVIDVENSEELIVYSTGKIGKATITVTILDSSHNKIITSSYPDGVSTSTTISVVDYVDKAIVLLTGQQEFLNINTSYTDADTEAVPYSVDSSSQIIVYLLSSTGEYLNTLNLTASLDSNNIASISKNDNHDGINLGGEYCLFSLNFSTTGTVRVEISCDGVLQNGDPVKFIFYCTYE